MARVGIVADSTCDLSLETLAALDVKMVPLKVLFGDDTALDWAEMHPEEFYRKLTSSPVLPKTSQPSPAEFAKVYAELADSGCESIVSVHLTSALSGTYASAEMAAADSPVPVHLIDTRKVSQATGLVVKAAVSARDGGADGAEVARIAQSTSDAMKMYFVLDTLEYLVKGGRAGRAQGLAASLLNIKPVLEMNAEGTIEPYKKVKGRHKALVEVANKVAADSEEHGRVRLAILNAFVPDFVEEFVTELDASGADYELESVGLVGAVIGTYAGPAAIGCAYYPIG